jgi:hypothetical protein
MFASLKTIRGRHESRVALSVSDVNRSSGDVRAADRLLLATALWSFRTLTGHAFKQASPLSNTIVGKAKHTTVNQQPFCIPGSTTLCSLRALSWRPEKAELQRRFAGETGQSNRSRGRDSLLLVSLPCTNIQPSRSQQATSNHILSNRPSWLSQPLIQSKCCVDLRLPTSTPADSNNHHNHNPQGHYHERQSLPHPLSPHDASAIPPKRLPHRSYKDLGSRSRSPRSPTLRRLRRRRR